MKKYIILLTLLVLILSACSAQPEMADTIAVQQSPIPPEFNEEQGDTATRQPITTEFLNTEFEDAASVRNQLTYGILLLEETDLAVTPVQAGALLPLFQALLALSDDMNSVSDEVNAVQNQILEGLNREQLEKITEFQITNTLLNGFYLENGVIMPTPGADSTRVPGSGGGMGRNLDQESREATRTAMGTEAGSGGGGQGVGQQGKTLLLDRVILLLIERSNE